MPDYEVLRFIWWLLLGVLLIGFAIMDGFDLGVASIYRFISRDDAERRTLLESIEPVWDGNQVWFILGGGAVFAAWPLLYAASFSALYLAMFLILVALILRPVGFNFRNKLEHTRWRNTWDWALFVGGVVPSLLFGVAFGNLFLGIPFHFDAMQRSVYTGGFFNLLHPYALLCGLVSLSMLVMHGAAYAALKVDEPMAGRARRLGRFAGGSFIVLFVVAGVWLALGIPGHVLQGVITTDGPSNPMLKVVAVVDGGWFSNYQSHLWLWLVPLAAVAAAAFAGVAMGAARDGLGFILTSLAIAATLITAATGLFPFLMPSSTVPAAGLTVWDASSSRLTLFIMLLATLIFMPIVLAYTSWTFHVLRGRINLEEVRRHVGLY